MERPSHSQEPKPEPRFLFADNGSVFEADEGSSRISDAVSYLRRLRSSGQGITPRNVAMLVEAQRWGEAFPLRDVWLEYGDLADWPGVPCQTSAEEAVKRVILRERREAVRLVCMWKNRNDSPEWPDDTPRVDPAIVSALVNDLAARIEAMPDSVRKAIAFAAPDLGPVHSPTCACEVCWQKLNPRFLGPYAGTIKPKP